MSLPFFYNYKEALVKKLKDDYAGAVNAKKLEEIEAQQMKEAQKLIEVTFKEMEKNLAEVVSVSKGEINFERRDECEIARLTINRNYVVFTWKDKKSIEVEVGNYSAELDMVEASIHGYIVPGEKKAVVKVVGKIHEGGHFDENSINYYLRSAFVGIVHEEMAGHSLG